LKILLKGEQSTSKFISMKKESKDST